ncbi:hypothetical protein AZA_90599 [Nitrospirillum viridazoti Y2]|nr:hypothetical protein AZA_90599 [Nitrospirillum amazonense Y2]
MVGDVPIRARAVPTYRNGGNPGVRGPVNHRATMAPPEFGHNGNLLEKGAISLCAAADTVRLRTLPLCAGARPLIAPSTKAKGPLPRAGRRPFRLCRRSGQRRPLCDARGGARIPARLYSMALMHSAMTAATASIPAVSTTAAARGRMAARRSARLAVSVLRAAVTVRVVMIFVSLRAIWSVQSIVLTLTLITSATASMATVSTISVLGRYLKKRKEAVRGAALKDDILISIGGWLADACLISKGCANRRKPRNSVVLG